ncbi:probable ubiquitin-like-specific protease 2B isoform X2 [Cynara cardunculus var. scolymus]|nr:probable ubiquitin-like-specific protease 2B isoform X2 [Cynara cardunculus var. scolymus]
MHLGKKFAEFLFDESDEVAEEKSRWKSTKSGKKKSRCGNSPVDTYEFLKSFAGGVKPKGKKSRNEPVIVHEVDEAVKERIFRSDAALQSSSSNNNSKAFSGSMCPDICTFYHGDSFNTPRSPKTATDRKPSDCTQRLHLADDESVSIISDEDNDNLSTMSSNDLADAEGLSGKQILEQEITSPEMDPNVVVYPEYVTYGRNCYRKAHLTFFPISIKLDVSEEEWGMGSLPFEWKIADLISIESRWLDHFVTAGVSLHIKSEHPKLANSGQESGNLEVTFAVCDPCWTYTEEQIKFLNEQYREKWEVNLDSYESFEDITYLEGDCDSISISKRDFQLLQPEKFINDTIVDFYIEYLKKKIKPADGRVHFFNSFFFRKLADFDENQLRLFDAEAAFQRVRKWTKKVNIFQKEYIFIPVNFRLHWSLIVICHPGEVVNFTDEELVNSLKVPCILHMDSIKGSHRGLENCIRCYLWEEWKERTSDAAEDISTKFMNLRFLHLEVPQQQNSYDCGLFMLHYMELFVKKAPINFNPLNNFISKAWFHPKEASLKRARIKSLIFELVKTNSQRVLSSGCNDKLSSKLKDVNEEEAEVQFLHETCDSKELFNGNISGTCANRSRDVNAKHMDINLLDSDTNGLRLLTSFEELQSHSEKFPETGDNGGSLIAANDQNHGQLVLYDPSQAVLSPIKESQETDSVTNAKSIKMDSFVACTEKCLNLLRLKESSKDDDNDDDVLETLVVEDSDECCSSSSSDDVYETCVVEDSDSDDLGESSCGIFSNQKKAISSSSSIRKDDGGKYLNGNRRRQPMGREARKRLRRSPSADLQMT